MKTHENLKKLLEDYTQKYFDKYFNSFPRVQSKFINDYLSSNCLALGKPEPLTKNKQFVKSCDNCRFTSYKQFDIPCCSCDRDLSEWEQL